MKRQTCYKIACFCSSAVFYCCFVGSLYFFGCWKYLFCLSQIRVSSGGPAGYKTKEIGCKSVQLLNGSQKRHKENWKKDYYFERWHGTFVDITNNLDSSQTVDAIDYTTRGPEQTGYSGQCWGREYIVDVLLSAFLEDSDTVWMWLLQHRVLITWPNWEQCVL